jgi:EF hand
MDHIARRVAFVSGIAIAAAGCHSVGPAAGSTTARDIEHTFLALDEDRDGMLTPAEAAESPALARMFEQADANNDGVLNRYEYNSPSWRPFPREPD